MAAPAPPRSSHHGTSIHLRPPHLVRPAPGSDAAAAAEAGAHRSPGQAVHRGHRRSTRVALEVRSVGHVGSPRRVAGAPRPEVHAAALALLVALGRDGGGELRSLLEELRQADEHNAALSAAVEQRMRELADLEAREAAVAETERRIDAKLATLRRLREQLDEIHAEAAGGG